MKLNNFSHHWCTIMVNGLIDRGVDHFFIAPGSRSTPIVSAVVRNGAATITHGIDERCVGFAALGYGKRAQKPGVVIVTSGTAVANLYPAVVEAYLSEVPLLLLTADRPYELRNCGANQTIWQADIFANHINKSFDMAPPLSAVSLNQSLAIFDQAVRSTMGPKKGPVHINVQLREPLANLAHEGEARWSNATLRPMAINHDITPHTSDCDVAGLLDFVSSSQGIIVVGELLPSRLQDNILDLASKLNWPVFADITSNLRLRHHPNLIHHSELLFLSRSFIEALSINKVLKFGARVVSKRFWAWIENLPQAHCLSMSESPERIDPTGYFEHVYVPHVDSVVTSLIRKLKEGSRKNNWPISPCFSTQVSSLIDDFLEHKHDNEAYFCSRLIAQLEKPVNLFLSSGMPIRDADQFAKPCHIPVDVFANRGASGIDGVISSAVGVAIADSKPVILLIGDVAFLHDTNGLMLIKQTKAPLLIIAINNNGGGIFHFLPIAHEADVISPYLDTPHETSIEHLCTAHKIDYELIHSLTSYDQALRRFFTEGKSMVIEIVIKRDINVGLHKDVYGRIASINPAK